METGLAVKKPQPNEVHVHETHQRPTRHAWPEVSTSPLSPPKMAFKHPLRLRTSTGPKPCANPFITLEVCVADVLPDVIRDGFAPDMEHLAAEIVGWAAANHMLVDRAIFVPARAAPKET
jgi:hypothetical protein